MKSIILIAPPAAGKGTQATLLCRKYHIPHISTGDLLRTASNAQTEFGGHLKEEMQKGHLISDDIIVKLLAERLKEKDCHHGYVLDGFPRNKEQAIIYEQLLKELDYQMGVVILLEVEKELARKRIVGRLICPKCNAIFNECIDEAKPKIVGLCDHCGSNLTKRKDDNNITFEQRYQTYLEKTAPLIAYYEEKGLLYRVPSDMSKEHTLEQIEIILDGSAT